MRSEREVSTPRRAHSADRLSVRIRQHRVLLLMVLPSIIFLLVFNYAPMAGIVLAFKDFRMLKGIFGSPWVGFEQFQKLFSNYYFFVVLKNTLAISVLRLVAGFPVPLLFALLLNEVAAGGYKKVIQTVSYLPHFMSWIILAGIFINLFSLNGPINAVAGLFGSEPVIFLTDKRYFRGILIVTGIWKEFGWGSIIYLAALSNVDVNLYEAAYMDGANRFQRAYHISIPSLVPVIVLLLILSTQSILNAGFDQIFNLYNPLVYDVSDIIDTWVYRTGLGQAKYSFSTALGLFKSLITLVLILATNKAANALGGKGFALW